MITFTISDKECELLKEFQKTHGEKHKGHVGAIGGSMIYKFCPSTLGTICIVQCERCHEELCLTDMGDW